jgi:hypothetical protein
MSDTITLTKLDDQADEIINRFAEETGLQREDTGSACVFAVEHSHNGIHVTQTLDAIDPDWPRHVGFEDPA